MEADVNSTTRTMSSMTTVDPNYLPIIIGSSVEITGKLSIDGDSSLSFGDIEIDNYGGVRDSWLNDIWAKRDIVIKLGDVRWPIADYRVQFTGLIDDIDSRDSQVLNLKIRDSLERINTPISDAKLGGSTDNKDELIPLTFGEVHNVSPLLTNPSTFEYQVHDGPIEDIIEVRANGVPVSITKDLSNGKFTLDANPHNQKITCSVQGDKPGGTYYNKIADIIEQITTRYGESTNRLTSGDIDSSNFSTFNAANTEVVGIYLRSGENVRRVCNQLANSVGAQIVMNSDGELQLHQITLPVSGTAIDIEADQSFGSNTFEDEIIISQRLTAQSTKKLEYNRNYTIQQQLETGIVQESKDLFEREWLSVISVNSTVKSDYRQQEEPEAIQTLLQVTSEAQAECDRRRQLFDQPRHIYTKACTAGLFHVQLGDRVNLYSHRFGLSGGAEGMVMGFRKRIEDATLTLDILV